MYVCMVYECMCIYIYLLCIPYADNLTFWKDFNGKQFSTLFGSVKLGYLNYLMFKKSSYQVFLISTYGILAIW